MGVEGGGREGGSEGGGRAGRGGGGGGGEGVPKQHHTPHVYNTHVYYQGNSMHKDLVTAEAIRAPPLLREYLPLSPFLSPSLSLFFYTLQHLYDQKITV